MWLCVTVIVLRLHSADLYGSSRVSNWEFRLSLHFQCQRTFWLGSSPFDRTSAGAGEHSRLRLTMLLCCGSTTRAGILNYLILLVCGDIHLNPGPARYPCGVCGKCVWSYQKGLLCDSCDLWFHTQCVQVSDADCAHYCSLVSFNWICTLCLFRQLPSVDICEDSLNSPLTISTLNQTRPRR